MVVGSGIRWFVVGGGIGSRGRRLFATSSLGVRVKNFECSVEERRHLVSFDYAGRLTQDGYEVRIVL